MISVIIPLYNKEYSVANAIKSVLNQSFRDFELIVVNDGSTDSSIEVVQGFSNKRIRLISQPNTGVSAARNRGVYEAKGEYVTFLDADDEWEASFLDEINILIEEYSDAIIYGTNYILKDYKGNKYCTTLRGLKFSGKRGLINNYFEIASVSSPPICSICVAMRRVELLNIGGFPTDIKSGEDLLTWARLLIKGDLAYSLKPLAIYNLSEGYEYGKEPVRRQDVGDPVGKELEKLLCKYPSTPGLSEYISHWHKMRASVAIRFGERKETIKECLLSLKYDYKNFKVTPFIILALIPKSIRRRIIALKKH